MNERITDQSREVKGKPSDPVGACDGESARESNEQGKKYRGHPRAGEKLVDERIERRDMLAVGDIFEIAIAEEQYADSGEVAEDDQAGVETALHKTSI